MLLLCAANILFYDVLSCHVFMYLSFYHHPNARPLLYDKCCLLVSYHVLSSPEFLLTFLSCLVINLASSTLFYWNKQFINQDSLISYTVILKHIKHHNQKNPFFSAKFNKSIRLDRSLNIGFVKEKKFLYILSSPNTQKYQGIIERKVKLFFMERYQISAVIYYVVR